MMPSFHDVFVFALYAFIFVAIFFVFYMVMSFVQYLVRENKIFEQFIKRGWIARNFDLTASVIVLLVGVGVFVSSDWFLGLVSSNKQEYNTIGQYVFNNPLVLVTLLGFPILIKRFDEMRLQTRVSQGNLKETQTQSRTSQYNTASELLWSENLGLRMAAIKSLERFAKNHPQDEYYNVMDVFSQFIRHPIPYEWEAGTKEENKKAGKRPDIRAILHTFERSMQQMMGKGLAESTEEIDLSGVDLQEAQLQFSNLNGVRFSYANLEEADMSNADLKGVSFDSANLIRANLMGSDVKGSHFYLAIINGANFLFAKNLTREQIRWCVFITGLSDAKKPPFLPKGMEDTYQSMTLDEWKEKTKSKDLTRDLYEHFYPCL